MDQTRIGRFISKKRKEQGMTQMTLAEKLGITDRAVSKWETGKSLPDASIMLEFCGLLGITVNELLSGEEVSVENYNEKAEQNLLEAIAQKELADKRLLRMEVVVGAISAAFLLTLVTGGALLGKAGQTVWAIVLMVFGMLQFIVAAMFCLRVEQVAGYYECAKCGHKYVPTFGSINFAMHMGRTRYMKCPCCGRRSWQKKVLKK